MTPIIVLIGLGTLGLLLLAVYIGDRDTLRPDTADDLHRRRVTSDDELQRRYIATANRSHVLKQARSWDAWQS